jgi:hypothetical protein
VKDDDFEALDERVLAQFTSQPEIEAELDEEEEVYPWISYSEA